MTAITISRWQRIRRTVQTVTLMLALSLTGLLPSVAGDISYAYDQLGRLIAVIDRYRYVFLHAVGNFRGAEKRGRESFLDSMSLGRSLLLLERMNGHRYLCLS